MPEGGLRKGGDSNWDSDRVFDLFVVDAERVDVRGDDQRNVQLQGLVGQFPFVVAVRRLGLSCSARESIVQSLEEKAEVNLAVDVHVLHAPAHRVGLVTVRARWQRGRDEHASMESG